MSDERPDAMPAGFQEWLRSALADSIPAALASLQDSQRSLQPIVREASSDSEDSRHSPITDGTRKRPWSDTPTGKGKAPVKKSKSGSLPLLPAMPLPSERDTSHEDYQILDEYRAGNSKPGTSRSRSPDHLPPFLAKNSQTENPDLPVEILDSSGFPLFDPRTLHHPRSAEWSPPQHIAEFLRYWLRRPLEKEVRQKLRAECPRPTLPDKVSSTPEFDPTFATFIMKNGKDPRKGLEQGLRSTQDKLLDVSGPLTQFFLMADEALTEGSQIDPHLAREWAQRALCLLGNANTALSTERRKAALFKLDGKLAELAPKELGPEANGLLFGDKFLKNLNHHVNIFTSLNKAQFSLRRVFQTRDRFSHRAGRQRGRATSRAAFTASRPRFPVASSYRFPNRTSYRTPYYRRYSRTRGSSSYRAKFQAGKITPFFTSYTRCRQTQSLLTPLGTYNSGSLGPPNCKGFPDRFLFPSTSACAPTSYAFISKRPLFGSQGTNVATGQERYRTRGWESLFYQQHVPGREKVRRIPPGYQSSIPQPICFLSTFQNGGNPPPSRPPTGKGLVFPPGLEGCLLNRARPDASFSFSGKRNYGNSQNF
ncbi:uncharacterized protein RCH25_046737 [Pelodytes ibericus]